MATVCTVKLDGQSQDYAHAHVYRPRRSAEIARFRDGTCRAVSGLV